MVQRAGWRWIVVGCLVACGTPAPARTTPTPKVPAREEPVEVVTPVTPTPVTPPDEDAERRFAAAEAAVDGLARQLEAVASACSTRWLGSDAACADEASFRAAASDYQAVYARVQDARSASGRIDALPRLGGQGADVEDVVRRIAWACRERCDLARRGALAETVGEAARACAKGAPRACADLEKRDNGAAARRSCETACADQKREAAAASAREARRPRDRAGSIACLQQCMRECTGGRVVVRLDGSYTKEPDDWCGTCDVSCAAQCETAKFGVPR